MDKAPAPERPAKPASGVSHKAESPRRRAPIYPTLARITASGRLILTDPNATELRTWMILLEPGEVHRMVTNILSQAECPVHDVISRIPEFAVDQASGLRPTVSLSMALELLERLTISRPIAWGFWLHSGRVRFGALTGRVDRRQSKSADASKYIFEAALDDFRRTWISWSLHPLDRDEAFLREYQALLRALSDLRPADGRLRPVLAELVRAHGVLSLGSWSCELPRNWKTRCTWQESPSDWAEFFIAIKYGCHTRKIKERLAQANLEQEIHQAWAAYGDWICQRPEEVRDLEGLLQGLRIGEQPATASANGSLETPANQ